MTTIVMQDNAVLFVGGAAAGDASCCCGCSCPECNEGVSIELNDGPSSSDGCDGCLFACVNSPTYHAQQATADVDNTHGGMTASMYCEPDAASPHGIIWRVTAVSIFANFGMPAEPSFNLFCTKTYSGTVQSDENCLPVAGGVSLTLDSTDDGGACDRVTTPTVTVVRA